MFALGSKNFFRDVRIIYSTPRIRPGSSPEDRRFP